MNEQPRGPDKPNTPGPPIGDPPPRDPPAKASWPMEDPFTEQATQPAGDGQGANRPQPGLEAADEDPEEAGPMEAGFSPVP